MDEAESTAGDITRIPQVPETPEIHSCIELENGVVLGLVSCSGQEKNSIGRADP